jgi:predicted NACHT family NTPase
MAKQSSLALQTDDPRISIPLQKIPLRVILRLYEKARIAEPQLSVFEYCARDIAQAITAPIETCRELLGYILTFGRAVLAFDGLDEILNTAQRREFVDLVVSFVDQFPLCPILVTSRVIGYKNAPMPADYDEFTLAPFNKNEVEHYLDRFFAKVFGLQKGERPSEISRFMLQTEKNAGDLRTNPLMLGLMAFLFSVKGDVPANRSEIYRECASLMFEKWDENRGIQPNIPRDFDLIDLFSVLALRIYGNAELEAGVSKEWLLNELTSYFATQYIERSKAFIAAKTVLDFITGRAWVMSDVGSDVYSFTHRTFLEFFMLGSWSKDAKRSVACSKSCSRTSNDKNGTWSAI